MNLELFTRDTLLKIWDKLSQMLWQLKHLKVLIKLNDHNIIQPLSLINCAGFYDHSTVNELLKECTKMQELNHPNVLTLMGVCLDGGPAPFIVLPFMANGSLLSYLKKNRNTLLLTENEEVVTMQVSDHTFKVLFD